MLESLNTALLAQTACYFGGGTAIVLLLDEYRESVDVDLLCASHDGYRVLRNMVSERSLGDLLTSLITLAREVRADRYGIRTFCLVDDTPIKLEIVREDRISLDGQTVSALPIPEAAWSKARGAYGASIDRALASSKAQLADPAHLKACLNKMSMDEAVAPSIHAALADA